MDYVKLNQYAEQQKQIADTERQQKEQLAAENEQLKARLRELGSE